MKYHQFQHQRQIVQNWNSHKKDNLGSIPYKQKFCAYSNPDSAVNNELNGKTWVLYFSLIPSSGSRIALYKDKQLEIAHVVIY
jgi:hypothetical protein